MNTQLSHIQVADAISPKNPTTAIATKKTLNQTSTGISSRPVRWAIGEVVLSQRTVLEAPSSR
jgi:hypothetical protein